MDDEQNAPMDQLSAHLDRGWDLVARGDFAGAILSAQKCLEVDESSPDAHCLLGYIYAAEGRAEEALEQYRTALDLEEGYFDAMLNAVEVLIHPLRDFEEALVLVNEALECAETDDERADALLLRIDALLASGEHDEAKRTVRLLPDPPFGSSMLAFQVGRAHYEVGDLENAEPALRSAVGDGAGPSDAYYYLGLVLDRKGDQRAALVAFLESRERDLAAPPPPWSVPLKQFERRVEAALRRLPERLGKLVEGALVVVSDLPGAEVVAEGVDPRLLVLPDDLSSRHETPAVGRIFVYQRNVERIAAGLLQVEDEVTRALVEELQAAFPGPQAGAPAAEEG
ncbi:MAG: tetratricopeptide repeat protein [Sandaracinaceae bacterium]